ncbi:hypothetical protein ACFCQI_03745 [Rhodanobacter sp. FW102-FHT14D06]|uniref:Uncharacterized protein n=2 Tax=unclassified Rhodanobacter TaxID=2621553 RepID=A0AB74UR54_9GAMM
MSDGLVSKDLRARNAADISEAKTFETHGVSRKAAMEFLRSPEGTIFRQRLIEADPGATASTIVDRAIQQIGSGIEVPRMELSAEPLLKIVPVGQQVPSFSPFFVRQSVFEDALASGKSLSNYFGLPIKSEAPRYDIMVMRPLAPTEIFIHRVAPTSELRGLVNKAGGGEQVLVPNRKLYEPPTYLKSIDDSLALRAERRVGLAVKGLGTGAATILMALDAYTTAKQYQTLSAQSNPFGADALLRRYEGRTAGGAIGGIGAGAAYGFVAGAETGPGALVTGVVGSVVGAFEGDRLAVTITEHKVNHQTGADGVTYMYEGGVWKHTHYQLDPDGSAVPDPYGAPSMQAVVTTAPAEQVAQLDYQRMTAITALALANPATQDTRLIELDGIRWHATRTGWAQTVELPGLPNNSFGIPAFTTVDRPADAQTAKALDQLAANREFNNAHYAEAVANAYVMDYYGKGWSETGPLPEVVTQALGLASEKHITDPQTGHAWNADGHGHFSREETRLIGRVVIHESHGASGEELSRLSQLQQSAVRANADYGRQLIAQKYEEWRATQVHAPIERGAIGPDHHPAPPESVPTSPDLTSASTRTAPPITPASSARAMFDALVAAARTMDIDTMRSIGQQYLQSKQGQAWLAAGQQLNQQLALQAGREVQAQQAVAMQR